ncbi:MAG: hypothetical protein J5854_03225 [Clostridia bacterium]|nr:hypothetical protein [Clostridia bacterium]
MTKDKVKKILPLAGRLAGILFIFVLILLICIRFLFPAFGWFAKNRKVTASDAGASSVAPNDVVIEEYRVYLHNYDSEGVVEVSNNVPSSALYEHGFIMNKYDTILTEHNANTRVVIRVLISNIPEDMTNLVITVGHTSPLANSSAALAAIFSNICSIEARYGANGDNIETVYSSFTGSGVQKFVTVSRSGASFTNTKVGSLTFNLGAYSSHVFTQSGTRKLVVYIALDYDPDLVEEFASQNENSTSFSAVLENNIDFNKDLTPFVISYSRGS